MVETNIQWASHTLNYYSWACTKVSPGCKNCYAKTLAERYGRNFDAPPQWRGKNAMRELRTMPAGSVVFVNSMSDTYHESAPVEWIHSIHNAALIRPDVTFLLLTKRPERAYGLSKYLAYPPNLWVGTSVESAEYLWRLEYLLAIPAAGHFVSAEPLLGSLTGDRKAASKRVSEGLKYYLSAELTDNSLLRQYATFKQGDYEYSYARWRWNTLKWVIVGAESGGNRRPFDLDWARELRDMTVGAGVPFMFKQGSAFKSEQERLLDGREWNETPFNAPAPVVTAPHTRSMFGEA